MYLEIVCVHNFFMSFVLLFFPQEKAASCTYNDGNVVPFAFAYETLAVFLTYLFFVGSILGVYD